MKIKHKVVSIFVTILLTVLLCILFSAAPAYASNHSSAQTHNTKIAEIKTPDPKKIEDLAKDRSWLRLLHLDAPDTQAMTATFYLSQPPLSSRYHVDALSELKINLERAQTDSQYRCQFPARHQWLQQHFTDTMWAPHKPCPELDRWRLEHPIQSVSIVYPNHSLGTSLSLFSHTFLKFNSAKLPINSSLNLSLGFAADLGADDSVFKMIYFGLFGGYIGKFTISNYYTELNRYGEAEARDIFEYDFTFNKNEVDLLMNHIWELRDIHFRYYFLNGNCSYHLFTLLEIARPELELSSQFHFVTIPLSSLKAILAQKGLTKDQRWVPGKQSRQKLLMQNLSPNAVAIYRQQKKQKSPAALAESLKDLSAKEQTIVLDLLSEANRGEASFAELRKNALSLRSQLPPDTTPLDTTLPKDLPQSSHDAHLWSVGAGYEQNDKISLLQLRYRFVLHGIMDPQIGHSPNTNLEVGDFRVRYSDKKKYDGSSFTIANAVLLSPWSEDEHSPSWQISSQILDFLNHASWKNSAGVGATIATRDISLYSMAIADSFMDQKEKLGMGVFAGASLGLVFNGFNKFKIRTHLDYMWPLQSLQENNFWQGELQGSYSFSTARSLQLSFTNSWREQLGLIELVNYF